MKKELRINEQATIWNEKVIVREFIYSIDCCDLCVFGKVNGYTSCPHKLCQKVQGKQVYFEKQK